MGFSTNEFSQISWQNSWNFNEEQTGNNINNVTYDFSISRNAATIDFMEKGLEISYQKLGQ